MAAITAGFGLRGSMAQVCRHQARGSGTGYQGRERTDTVKSLMAPSTTAIDVMIEIPTGSRNKYEYDHENHVIRLDRRLFTATAYPADYGFVPDTLSKDGDPLDALVLVADPTFPGCMVRARILGVFFMRDEAGLDAKLLTVLEHDPQWDGAEDIGDLPAHLLNEIEHFFSIYKDLEPEKHTEVMGFEGRDAALTELEACREAYRADVGKLRSKGRRAADA